MEIFAQYLANIEDAQHRARTKEILNWVTNKFPALAPRIAWNQPMFTQHGTYIIGFSVSKHHLAVAPERDAINHFSDKIYQVGYEHSKELIRIKWENTVDFAFLEKIIEFNISDKANCSTFWRK